MNASRGHFSKTVLLSQTSFQYLCCSQYISSWVVDHRLHHTPSDVKKCFPENFEVPKEDFKEERSKSPPLVLFETNGYTFFTWTKKLRPDFQVSIYGLIISYLKRMLLLGQFYCRCFINGMFSA